MQRIAEVDSRSRPVCEVAPIASMAIMNPQRRECLQKMKYGAMQGGGVGAAAGVLFGSYEVMGVRGIPSSQKVGLVLRNSVGGGIALAFFLAIGTGIRSCNSRPRY